jgi:hypothetical protein
MALTENDLLQAVGDSKFMASRYKRRVAISEVRLEKMLNSGMLSLEQKSREVNLHKQRIGKWKEWEKKAKNI